MTEHVCPNCSHRFDCGTNCGTTLTESSPTLSYWAFPEPAEIPVVTVEVGGKAKATIKMHCDGCEIDCNLRNTGDNTAGYCYLTTTDPGGFLWVDRPGGGMDLIVPTDPTGSLQRRSS